MRHPLGRSGFGAVVLVVLSGCSVPFVGGEDQAARKSRCDRMAAQAIETQDVAEARRFAAQAADCYAAIMS